MKYARGVKSFDAIVGSDLPKSGKGKGRNKDLLKLRDHVLLCRYYYYAKLLHMRYDLVLLELSKELFLSMDTIPRIVEREIGQIKKMTDKKITVVGLEQMYPNWNWNHKPIEIKIKEPEREVYVLGDRKD